MHDSRTNQEALKDVTMHDSRTTGSPERRDMHDGRTKQEPLKEADKMAAEIIPAFPIEVVTMHDSVTLHDSVLMHDNVTMHDSMMTQKPLKEATQQGLYDAHPQ